MKYKFLPHTADIKFKAFGRNLEKVFENSALALFNIICNEKIKEKKKYKIKTTGKDYESLLYNFLEEFLVLFDSKNFLSFKIKDLKLDSKNLRIECSVSGDDALNYNVNSIKAITYNEMFIKKIGDKFVSQVVVDV